jgi:uncharacterized protein (TIGR00297 family)
MNQALNVIAMRCAVGLILSSAVGWLAYRRKSLSRSGIAGAILTGTLIFSFGGIISGLLLIAFFVTSSALSHYKKALKRDVAEQFDKGNQRDLGQALANGGVATVCAIGSGIALVSQAPMQIVVLWLAGMIGALATANADTWATELGVLSRTPPRLITHLAQTVEPGTSGGVTLTGTLAAFAGALFIGVATALLACIGFALFDAQSAPWVVLSNAILTPAKWGALLCLSAIIGGFSGSIIDSLIGATIQAMHYSEARKKTTERAIERDGTPNRFIRGWRWLNNDWVNFLATLCGAALGGLVTFAASSIFNA